MSLYYEAAAALTAPAADGGNLKTRIFGPRSGRKRERDQTDHKESKAPPTQVYALAVETAKWSAVLAEVIDAAGLLAAEGRRLPSPVLALLLVHDLLLSPAGVRLPPAHGLHAAVARHRARLAAELTRARLRRGAPSLEALRTLVEAAAAAAAGTDCGAPATRWIRINRLRTTLAAQLATTFCDYRRVDTLPALWRDSTQPDGGRRLYVDEHVPDLVAVPLLPASSSATVPDLLRADAYRSGALIFQDKASCFPAYLLDPAAVGVGASDDAVDLVDACAAPGNKTSHLAALVHALHDRGQSSSSSSSSIEVPLRPCLFAFEKDPRRAQTLQTMLQTAGALDLTHVGAGKDFLQVDPADRRYRQVRALLLDPSCSGSGIVGRDAMPVLHLPQDAAAAAARGKESLHKGRKRKRKGPEKAKPEQADQADQADKTDKTDDETKADKDAADAARLDALAAFQLAIVLHAFRFPAARRVTYSTCSIHAWENEEVVVRALAAAAADRSGWRLLRRDEQVDGMRRWPVRGDPAAVDSLDLGGLDAAGVADACIRSYPDDVDRGIMGFFVAAFVRDDAAAEAAQTATANVSDAAEASDDGWDGFDD